MGFFIITSDAEAVCQLTDGKIVGEVREGEKERTILGDLVFEGGSDLVHEFRSAEQNNIVPALRIKINDKEMYPLYAVPYGKGYLLVAGMDLEPSGIEFKKMIKAISGLVDYLLKQSQ